MTDQNLSPTEPVAGAPASWAQPPANRDDAGWAQPPATGGPGRLLFGSTQARVWQPDPGLAARRARLLEVLAAEQATSVPPAAPPAGHTPVRTFTPTVQNCPRCGGSIDWDGYCEMCGAKAPTVREHFEEEPSNWVAGVCDRGVRHPRNEDAMALDATAEADRRAALVICDGVSMSTDSDKASLAAARAALAFLLSRPEWDWELLDIGERSATRWVLDETARTANGAVLENSDLAEASPASCTLAIGLVNGNQLLAATLGDSRVYWLPDAGVPTQLSTDHSMAQEEIEMGVDREVAEAGVNGHVITRWLGRDAPDITPRLTATRAEGAGWLLVCSDGLWNYASDAVEMAQLVKHYAGRPAATPLQICRDLVRWANEQGGHDNITVALARLTGAPAPGAAPDGQESDEATAPPTIRTRPPAAETTVTG